MNWPNRIFPDTRRCLVAAGIGFALVSDARAADANVNSVGMTMVRIGSGEFAMGSTVAPANWDEQPVHGVAITHGLAVSRTEVTADQFRAFRPDAILNATYAPFAAGMSWQDAVDFCAWLSEKDGRSYRLPTEAEWEYICRAGRRDNGNWEIELGAANPWGVQNMLSGPVEWCLDWYGEYGRETETNPVGMDGGFMRVVRGGYLDKPDKFKGEAYRRPSNRAAAPPTFGLSSDAKEDPDGYGMHRIGFRVVLAPPVESEPRLAQLPFARLGVKLSSSEARRGPDESKPYFRRRRMLPIPPEDADQDAINRAGLHPSFRGHNHSPGFELLPNGDALLVIYSSYHEYEPEVSLIAARLRFGAEQWDMPSQFLDTPGANDHAPLLWRDADDTLWLFWGHPLAEGHFPFQYITSRDYGTTWSEVKFPHVTGPRGPDLERPQPINTVIRDRSGTILLAVDAAGGGPLGSQSMLWATDDGGKSWHDTLGRTGGRHTTFVLRNDGSILGMGGKNSGIGDFMPRSISRDGGRTYAFSKTPFSQLNSGQRPSILRLASGRLFMTGDFQPSKRTRKPESIKQSGAYVALSDDDGETWHIKRLPGAFSRHRGWPSVGYSVARQAPNGCIHLITTLNHPALHFEMNEAWILSDKTLDDNDPGMDRPTSTDVSDVREHRENYPDGAPRIVWSSGLGDDGRVLLHGNETWFYESGRKQREANYRLGIKSGRETFWLPTGVVEWETMHRDDGVSVTTTYWPDGTKRSESSWANHELVPGSDTFLPHAGRSGR